MQSPSPLCSYYRWIDTEQPDWALREIEERSRRAWRKFHEGERREKAEALEKAAQEKEMREYKAERRRFLQEMGRKNDEAYARQEEEKRRRTEAREAERQRLKERARQEQAAEEAGDGKGKYPRWTQ